MLTGKSDLDQFLLAMEAWMLGLGFRYRHMTNNGVQTYVIQRM